MNGILYIFFSEITLGLGCTKYCSSGRFPTCIWQFKQNLANATWNNTGSISCDGLLFLRTVSRRDIRASREPVVLEQVALESLQAYATLRDRSAKRKLASDRFDLPARRCQNCMQLLFSAQSVTTWKVEKPFPNSRRGCRIE